MQTTHSMKVLLLGGDKVNDFVKIASGYSFPIFLTCGRYRINGKSLIGIFSLDLSRPLTVQAENCTDEEADDLFQELQKFAVGQDQGEEQAKKSDRRFSLFGKK
ncbi:MAG: HPr family phosphocarrier protein [Oscillospiraceae bacterium]|nr:HPr family phosphocarrier protein [Oscillospiraceae bacterium]